MEKINIDDFLSIFYYFNFSSMLTKIFFFHKEHTEFLQVNQRNLGFTNFCKWGILILSF